MPRRNVEQRMSLAEKNLVLYGQNPAYDVRLSGQSVHFATAGAAVMIADTETNSYRDSKAQDLYDMARIADTCEHIHIFQRMCVLRDIPDNYEMDLNTLYCSVMGTAKHVGSSWTDVTHLEKSLEILHIIAGGEAQWRARPFVSQSNCFVVPPMKFTEEALNACGWRWKAACRFCCCPPARPGATTPACLAGRCVTSLGRMPGWPGLRERHQARRAGHSWRLAVCI